MGDDVPASAEARHTATEERLAAAYRRLAELNRRSIFRALPKLAILIVFTALRMPDPTAPALENMLFLLAFISALPGVLTRARLSPLVLGPWDEAAFFYVRARPEMRPAAGRSRILRLLRKADQKSACKRVPKKWAGPRSLL